MWKELISPYVNAQHVAIVAHSYGGIVVMEMVLYYCPVSAFFQLLVVLFTFDKRGGICFYPCLFVSVCLSVCLSVSKIAQKCVHGF